MDQVTLSYSFDQSVTILKLERSFQLHKSIIYTIM